MTPLLLLGAGIAALAAGRVLLASFGPGYRVGRLLATTPTVSVGEARTAAESGAAGYVRVQGRIDSEDDFEDADHRPLVFRRTRVQVAEGRGWRTVEDGRESVPFEIREGLDAIAVEPAELGDGLVVVPRESTGTAGDIPDRVPAGIPAATPVRVRIDQISSVEHAIVLGVPVRAAGRVRLAPGRGRPLVLTTLEPDEAMRVLSGGARRRLIAAGALLAGGGVLVLVGIAGAVAAAGR